MFTKTIFEDAKEFVESIPVFPVILKIADFRWKNAGFSRTQGMCHMIYVFFGSSFGKV